MDIISIKRLKIFAHHGVYDFEKKNGQTFYVDVRLFCNLQNAGRKDSLENTINYALVCEDVEDFFVKNTYDLIETTAERLAVYLLNKYNAVKEITLTVHKPEAPIGQSFEDISVEVTRKRHRVYIAYGSNEGDSKSIIEEAIGMIDASEYASVIAKSKMIKSTPYGEVEQNDFYNGVIGVDTYLGPLELLDWLHEIEADFKRVRKVHWGPRTLDLDILLYDDEIIDGPTLTIPHADMLNRDFVMKPLAEIAPYIRHPLENETIEKLASRVGEVHIMA